jgi:hypothetical protein
MILRLATKTHAGLLPDIAPNSFYAIGYRIVGPEDCEHQIIEHFEGSGDSSSDISSSGCSGTSSEPEITMPRSPDVLSSR